MIVLSSRNILLKFDFRLDIVKKHLRICKNTVMVGKDSLIILSLQWY